MPTIRVATTNMAANSTNFPLSGNQFEYLPYNAQVLFAVVATAATVDVSVFSGADVLQQGGPPIIKALGAGTGTVFPDDFLLDDVAAQGERISVVLRETGNVATTDAETTVRITPIF